MKLFIIFSALYTLSVSAHAQALSSFEGMSTEEVRQFIIT